MEAGSTGSTCVPLGRNSSTDQSCGMDMDMDRDMESSRALRAKQNRKNFVGVPTDLLIFPKNHGTYSLCGHINHSSRGRGTIHKMPVVSRPWKISPDFFSSVYSSLDESK